jgi:SAM-dependent methyltransferase
MSTKFDKYEQSYREEVERSIAFAGVGIDVFTEAKAAALLRLIRNRLGDPAEVRALDVGCGPGETDAYLVPELAELCGVDISSGVLDAARKRNPSVSYRDYDGDRLPYDDDSFDVAFAICVIHHVPPDRWQSFTAELVRVVRTGGLAVLVEHNPRNPLTRLAVARCAFDDDAVLLSPGTARQLLRDAGLARVESRYIVFHPFRSLLLRRLDHALGRVPLGAQYLCAGEPA